ncbi:hypothetical protein AVEN_204968-1 [Araneus ventricosus]|uniref:Uncharacterized protein n=1 Tax=Araneus ventricosus TaxID=182803 RepID=A0A4Y2NUH9_ARAVE|nr:hypothetical protein AVEN_204968-1 [Araneus ventricosus]
MSDDDNKNSATETRPEITPPFLSASPLVTGRFVPGAPLGISTAVLSKLQDMGWPLARWGYCMSTKELVEAGLYAYKYGYALTNLRALG